MKTSAAFILVTLICGASVLAEGSGENRDRFKLQTIDGWTVKEDRTHHKRGTLQLFHPVDKASLLISVEEIDHPLEIRHEEFIRQKKADLETLGFNPGEPEFVTVAGLEVLKIRAVNPDDEPRRPGQVLTYNFFKENQAFHIVVATAGQDPGSFASSEKLLGGLSVYGAKVIPKPDKSASLEPAELTAEFLKEAVTTSGPLLLLSHGLNPDDFPTDYPSQGAQTVSLVAGKSLVDWATKFKVENSASVFQVGEIKQVEISGVPAAVVTVSISDAGGKKRETIEITWMKTKGRGWKFVGVEDGSGQ